jgi:WD40 repeat protein
VKWHRQNRRNSKPATLLLLVSVLACLVSPLRCLPQLASDSGPQLVLQTGHNRSINALAFSPDGRWLASSMNDKSFKLWEVARGREVRTLSGHAGEVKALVFSPDGHLLASGSEDRTIKLWDVASGHELRTLSGHSRAINALMFSPDGQLLASGGFDGVVILWETATGREVRTLSGPEHPLVHALAFSPDGRLLSWATDGNFVNLCEVATGRVLLRLTAHDGPVTGVAFSADGRYLTSAGGLDATVKVWEVASGRLQRTIATHGLGAGKATFSLDGSWVAVQSPEIGVVAMLVGVRKGAPTRVLPGGNGADAMTFSKDGRWLATGSGNGNIELWDVATGLNLHTLSGHTEFVWAVAFSPDRRWLATGGLDNTVRLWELATGRQTRPLTGHTSYVTTVAFSPDSRWLASGSWDGVIKLWDIATGRELSTLTGHTKWVMSISFSPDGRWLASGSMDRTLRLWDMNTRLSRASLPGNLVGAVAFSPDSRWLAIAFGSVVILGELATGRQLQTATHQNFTVSSLAFSPDGRRLASGSGDHTVKVWDVPTGRELYTLSGHRDWVHAVAFSPDGRWLASGGEDHVVKMWDAATGAELRTLSGHTHDVHCLAFSPDGKWLASASNDGSTRIWNTATGAEQVALVSLNHGGGWLVVAPDGLFDGTADAMQLAAAWRANDSNETLPLDAFFTDFYQPGLFGDIMAGSQPTARVDIATAMQVPGLRAMLAGKMAHIEDHGGQIVVCFDEKPGAVINVGPTDQRAFFPPVNGYKPGTTPSCKFEKALPTKGANSAAIRSPIQDLKPETVTTPWDGKLSATANSKLNVLAIAVSEYPGNSGFDPLPYAVPSAKGIEMLFREQQAVPTKPYQVIRVWDGLYDSNATRESVLRRLSEVAKDVSEEDVVLIYLAGHGKVSVGEEMFYFVPVDGRDADLRSTAVSTAMIAEALENLPARRIVLIVDACQSGGAIEALSKIGAVKAKVQERRTQQATGRSGQVDGVGVHMIAATLPLSYAIGLKDGKSVLADTLQNALRLGTTAGQLTAYVRDHLPAASDRVTHGFRQVPLTESIGLDFPIALKVGSASSPE